MKHFKTLTIFIIVILFSILACKKEEKTPAPAPAPAPTINQIVSFFSDNIVEAIQSSTVDVSNWTSITNSGAEIWIGPNSFVDANGLTVTGVVDIELIVELDNKQMLMLNRPTVTNNGGLLTSGGIIYINATQMGEQLQIDEPLQTNMPNIDMGGNVSSPLSIWNGETTDNGDFVWIEDTTNQLWSDSSYYFALDTIGWTNLDVLADTEQGVLAGDDLSVFLPSGLNGGNSFVMMYFTSINSFASIYDSNNDGTFTPGYYQVPIGTIVKFVVISMDNNIWSYHVSNFITINGPTTSYPVPALTPAANEQAMQTAVLNSL